MNFMAYPCNKNGVPEWLGSPGHLQASVGSHDGRAGGPSRPSGPPDMAALIHSEFKDFHISHSINDINIH